MRFLESGKREEEEESLPRSYKKRSFSKLYQQGQDKLNSEVFRATESRKAEGRRRSAVKAREQFRIETTTKHIRSSVEGQVPYSPTYRIFIHSFIHSLHTCIPESRRSRQNQVGRYLTYRILFISLHFPSLPLPLPLLPFPSYLLLLFATASLLVSETLPIYLSTTNNQQPTNNLK